MTDKPPIDPVTLPGGMGSLRNKLAACGELSLADMAAPDFVDRVIKAAQELLEEANDIKKKPE